jgi:hypothetical protein
VPSETQAVSIAHAVNIAEGNGGAKTAAGAKKTGVRKAPRPKPARPKAARATPKTPRSKAPAGETSED